MKKLLKVALMLCAGAAASTAALKDAAAKSWTCDATFAYASHSYMPPTWEMSSRSLFPDREHRCREAIFSTWLDSNAIIDVLGLTDAEKAAICSNGGTFQVRVDYGFDKRGKDWSFVNTVTPPCVC